MARAYELKKGNFSIKVSNWGATILSVVIPDSKGGVLIHGSCSQSQKVQILFGFQLCSLILVPPSFSCAGKLSDIVLGYEKLSGYSVSFDPHQNFTF